MLSSVGMSIANITIIGLCWHCPSMLQCVNTILFQSVLGHEKTSYIAIPSSDSLSGFFFQLSLSMNDEFFARALQCVNKPPTYYSNGLSSLLRNGDRLANKNLKQRCQHSNDFNARKEKRERISFHHQHNRERREVCRRNFVLLFHCLHFESRN